MRTNASTSGKTRGQYKFAELPNVETPRSRFDRSSGLTTTFNSGYLVPIFVDEVLPGDSVTMNVATFARLSTPIVPVMDNLYLDIHWWFCANRILWDNWVHFMGEKTNPDDTTTYLVPTVGPGAGGQASNTLWDYFGLPLEVEHNAVAFPFRAYNRIYNQFYRDQDLIDSVPDLTGNGPDSITNYTLLRRGKRHDYFTSARPAPQKGNAVELPIGGSAPVTGTIAGTGAPTFDGGTGWTNTALTHDTNNPPDVFGNMGAPTGTGTLSWNNPQLALTGATADLSSATAATINSIREAFQLQKMYEKDMRGGTRYSEMIRSHFGVTMPDSQWRPEFLGGASSRITFHPVSQTNATNATSPQGNLAAFATGSIDGRGFSKSFTEHGFIIGLASVRADQTYEFGMERMWSRQTRFDYYFPTLAHLGEQEVLNKELYAAGDAGDEDIFGYQERWAEYRYKPSKITGLMRSYVTGTNTTLNYWHLAQDWASRPTLNQTFIEENPPLERVIASSEEPEIFMDAFFQMSHVRAMPIYSVPGFVDHF